MSIKTYYGDVEVLMKMRLRVEFKSNGAPNEERMLEILNDQDFEDIHDEEHLEYIEVKSMDFKDE